MLKKQVWAIEAVLAVPSLVSPRCLFQVPDEVSRSAPCKFNKRDRCSFVKASNTSQKILIVGSSGPVKPEYSYASLDPLN